VTVKATGLESALELAPPAQVGEATVIPLLNGVDHVAVLRARYANVVAGAMRVESERVAPGRIRQTFPYLQIDLAGAESLVPELRQAGIHVHVEPDEVSLLWRKLAFLAPLALATSAFDGPLGAVREDDRYLGCLDEAIAVAHAEGARIDDQVLRKIILNAPSGFRSSMQKDVAEGRPPELDAIAGPIQRGGRRHGIPTPKTDELARLVDRAVRERSAEPD
jgi:2-dehydropantoate 2-reductase